VTTGRCECCGQKVRTPEERAIRELRLRRAGEAGLYGLLAFSLLAFIGLGLR
jgi:hypothetical protein